MDHSVAYTRCINCSTCISLSASVAVVVHCTFFYYRAVFRYFLKIPVKERDPCFWDNDSFPQFHLAGCKLSFVPNFKYLGHIIDNSWLQDDDDVYRELKCLFTRTNILIRRFSHCSLNVKLRLFRSFCICFYDIALWRHVKATVVRD